MICGRYVRTFAEASHALPQGMHMNADYPFMLPPITALDGNKVTIRGGRGELQTFTIQRGSSGEFGHIEQSSTYERLFSQPPHRFTLLPFKDEKTAAAGAPSPSSGGEEP